MNRLLISAFVFFATSGVIACMAQGPIPGGYSPIAVTTKEVMDAAAFAVNMQQKAMENPEGGPPVRLELVAIEGAEEQVVAGMNYRLRIKVKLDGRERDVAAVVWWQAWKKSAPYQLTSWDWK
jgi:hypothetical protein